METGENKEIGKPKGMHDGRHGGKLNSGPSRPNQGGRPKGKSIKTILRDVLEGKAIYPVDGKPTEMTRAEAIVYDMVTSALIEEDASVRLKFQSYIIDRLEGKANQPLTGEDGGPVKLSWEASDI